MTEPGLSQEDTRAALTELEHALYNHEQWCEGLYTTLICRLPPDKRDIEPDAHHKCRFGQWYYGALTGKLRSFPGFAEIAAEHERLHQSARSLLLASAGGSSIALPDYKHFVAALKRMRLEIVTIKHELEYALFSLDPLTGSASRVGMLTRLREQHELAKRKVMSFCLAMMDLENFKAVNDTYGHAVGDRVLIAFARHVMSRLRPYDKFFRYGGEEFLIVLSDATIEAARDIVERLRIELAAIAHDGNSPGRFHVTVSFGLTVLDPDVFVEESIDRADKALYLAKSSGRNRTIVWNPGIA